jgi:hypothetical protein
MFSVTWVPVLVSVNPGGRAPGLYVTPFTDNALHRERLAAGRQAVGQYHVVRGSRAGVAETDAVGGLAECAANAGIERHDGLVQIDDTRLHHALDHLCGAGAQLAFAQEVGVHRKQRAGGHVRGVIHAHVELEVEALEVGVLVQVHERTQWQDDHARSRCRSATC